MKSVFNIVKVLICMVLVSSCGVLNKIYEGAFEKGGYQFNYAGGQKSIDFRKGNWLIAYSNAEHILFFKKYLGNRLEKLNSIKNKEGKFIYGFDINPNPSDKELSRIKELTKYDYLITFSHQSDNLNNITYLDKRETSVLNVYSLSSGFLKYQIVCRGESYSDDNRVFDMDTESKLFFKVNRYAKY